MFIGIAIGAPMEADFKDPRLCLLLEVYLGGLDNYQHDGPTFLKLLNRVIYLRLILATIEAYLQLPKPSFLVGSL